MLLNLSIPFHSLGSPFGSRKCEIMQIVSEHLTNPMVMLTPDLGPHDIMRMQVGARLSSVTEWVCHLVVACRKCREWEWRTGYFLFIASPSNFEISNLNIWTTEYTLNLGSSLIF